MIAIDGQQARDARLCSRWNARGDSVTPTTGPSFRFSPSVLCREDGGEITLLHLESDECFTLNRVGARIVLRVTEESFEAALRALADTYDVAPDVLRRDVDDLVAGLVSAGLLDPVGSD